MFETGATNMLHLSDRALDHFRMVLILATGYISNFQEGYPSEAVILANMGRVK